MKSKYLSFFLLLFIIFISLASCSNDDNSNDSDEGSGVIDPDPDPNTDSCENSNNLIFEEENGLLVVEFESLNEVNGWAKERTVDGFLGTDYIVWDKGQFLGTPGNGLLTYNLKITNPGTYRFIWRSRVNFGDSGADHNDSWLRFDDANQFYGKKGESFVYPADRNLTPLPNGASKDGWFKIYRSGKDSWKWQSSTSDNDGHDIFVVFDDSGIYTMEVSIRSSYHALDRFVLFSENVNQADATDSETVASKIECN